MTATQTKSTITRSWKTTITYLAIAVVAGAISFVMFKTMVSGAISFGFACIPAILCLIFLFMAMSGAGECPCPGCGKTLDGLSTGSNDGKLCESCGRYYEGTGGELWATEESRVADTPIFSSPIPENFAFPDACCVCGKPPTHREAVSMTRQNTGGSAAAVGVTAVTGGVISGGGSSTRTTVQVPHCDEHKEGASLGGTTDKPHVRFRSYPYLRAFCELNKTKPG
jgi:hypothetical protein